MFRHLNRVSFLWSYTSPWKWEILLSLFALTFVSFTTLIYPWLLKLMVDQFSGQSIVHADVSMIMVALALLFLLSTLLGYYQQLTMHSLGYRLRNAVRIDLYQHLLERPMAFHRNQQVGELSARATEDVGKLQAIFVSLVAPVYQNLLIVAGGLALSILLNWAAALILVFFMTVPIPFVLRYSHRIRALGAKSQADHARANAHLEESLVAIREVKAFAREESEVKRYSGFLRDAFRNEVSASKMVIRGNQAAYFLLSAMLLTTFYLAAVSAMPNWTLGSMVAFYFYAYTMAMALLSIGRIYLTYQSVTGALDRIVELLTPQEQIRTPTPWVDEKLAAGTVEFSEVSFGYSEGKEILHEVSFSIEDGTWAVIGGPSGSGKSTIASLIMSFYDPLAGDIKIGGHSIKNWNKKTLRGQIGYVGQDPLLFHGSIRENLLVAGRIVRDKEIEEVLRTTCLKDTIAELSHGVDTIVGERGYTLSGGQKARVAIARALLFDPIILILDEPNTMLEEKLEIELWKNLAAERQNRTTIILTHHATHIPPNYKSLRIEHGMITVAHDRIPQKQSFSA